VYQVGCVYYVIKGASVNQAILQHCFFWFGNTGADAAIAILLPTLKRSICNGAMDPELFEIHSKRSQNCQRLCETLSEQ
jgi:hypothetical protein